MAENLAKAREQLSGHRKAVEEHIEKWRRYPDQQDKSFALKTIENAQGHIAKLKQKYPALSRDTNKFDSWRP